MFLLWPMLGIKPDVFFLTFLISGAISMKFPNFRFYMNIRDKKFRIHHAFLGGLVAFFASFSGHLVWFNIGLAGMLHDIISHFLSRINSKRSKLKV